MRTRRLTVGLGVCWCLWLLLPGGSAGQQVADPDFDTTVARPAYPACGPVVRVGMNVPGYDNRQFVLNVLHWLSGLLD